MPFQPDPVWLLARVFGPAAGFLLTLVSAAGSADFQTLKGHGGPVMDIDVSLETGQVATASFDNSVGIWKDRVPQWLEGHAAAVKVVSFRTSNVDLMDSPPRDRAIRKAPMAPMPAASVGEKVRFSG